MTASADEIAFGDLICCLLNSLASRNFAPFDCICSVVKVKADRVKVQTTIQAWRLGFDHINEGTDSSHLSTLGGTRESDGWGGSWGINSLPFLVL
jgi:hypothetical protein